MENKKLRIEGQSVEVVRGTNLTEVYYDALLNRLALFFKELAAELGEPENMVDVGLSSVARIASQTRGYDKLPVLSDSLEEMRDKCKQWLTNSNPRIAQRLIKAIEDVNSSWGSVEEGPNPLPENADPKA
jgi:hypothetical protein